ncbi:MAG: GGDEF domain-containing protein [Gammaproteobacteria bacterium]|nr:GGDEF domain-containing protein [Gammaproteobacteria bacterium]
MLKTFDAYFESMNQSLLLLIMIAATVLLGFVDYSTGPELSFSVFYTGPIMLTVWYGRGKKGLIIVFLSALIWMIVDIIVTQTYSNPLIPIWNTLARLGFFLIILNLLLAVKNKLILEESLADTDPLTGLANRRYLMEQLEIEYSRVNRYPEPFTIAYLDLDNFKYVNDTLGHDIGDILLETVASYLKENTRSMDTPARLGGDEFAILLPYLGDKSAIPLLNEMHKKLLELMKDNDWPVTFSIGAITYNKTMPTTRDMIKAVDDLMYEVKKSGKNNIRHRVWPD